MYVNLYTFIYIYTYIYIITIYIGVPQEKTKPFYFDDLYRFLVLMHLYTLCVYLHTIIYIYVQFHIHVMRSIYYYWLPTPSVINEISAKAPPPICQVDLIDCFLSD